MCSRPRSHPLVALITIIFATVGALTLRGLYQALAVLFGTLGPGRDVTDPPEHCPACPEGWA